MPLQPDGLTMRISQLHDASAQDLKVVYGNKHRMLWG